MKLVGDAACRSDGKLLNAIYINEDGLICGDALWGEFGRERSGVTMRG